jgi:hypothetical protein
MIQMSSSMSCAGHASSFEPASNGAQTTSSSQRRVVPTLETELARARALLRELSVQISDQLQAECDELSSQMAPIHELREKIRPQRVERALHDRLWGESEPDGIPPR